MVAKEVFIMETVIFWHCNDGQMKKNNSFFYKFSYINNHLYSVINFNHVILKYIEPCNFLTKFALVSQPSMLMIAKDLNILHYLNSSIYLPIFILAIIQYIPRNMHTVFALLCFVVVIHWLIFPYPSGLLHWHCGNLTIAPVPAKQPWWIWINTSCEFIMNDCITTTKQSTTKPCAYFLGYTVQYTPNMTVPHIWTSICGLASPH